MRFTTQEAGEGSVSSLTPNIWQMQSRRDIEGLTEALTNADPDVRKRAATALRTLDAAEAVPALEAALAVEDDWQAQEHIVAAIQYLSRESRLSMMIRTRDVEGLTSLLYSPQVEEVISAAEALGELGDRGAVEALVAVFHNQHNPDMVRLAAAEALIKLQCAPGVVTLLAALRRDDWQVRRNAAAILGQLRATWATPALVVALHDENAIVRRTALAALRRIGTPEAMQAVEGFVEEPEAVKADEYFEEEPFGEADEESAPGEGQPGGEQPAVEAAAVAAPGAGESAEEGQPPAIPEEEALTEGEPSAAAAVEAEGTDAHDAGESAEDGQPPAILEGETLIEDGPGDEEAAAAAAAAAMDARGTGESAEGGRPDKTQTGEARATDGTEATTAHPAARADIPAAGNPSPEATPPDSTPDG